MPLLAYTVSVAQEPETTTLLSSLLTSGAGTWNSTLAAGSAGTFSSPSADVPPLASPPGVVPVPVPPVEPAVSSLPPSSPEDRAYQTPPPMIRAIATTAETMIATWALIFRPPPPPPPGCGPDGACMGTVGCW
ncbi:putative protein OS=Streptomyces fumanus OX=67302 GN=GCM10018772_32340 PE=4 SV=1 [Streptomyces fumanus]|uniref:Uncharacterized protein n=1 Tax=Streptomyces fumanus TaxID=67302 RepID=A0A919AGK6_9ACTN|nr:hypothetical protein GCM10018772_32340 [Streptomyces fumanus]